MPPWAHCSATTAATWAPQLQRTVSTQSCDGCTTRRYRNDACAAERHHCMEGVGPHQVIDWVEAQLS
ncbi:hypothetical protein [Vulcanococcus sp.]|jgi:hypothetical protein|uniref:hypothetical protein n=1 Tax=Vulcanococcus sp. TaxID=2856995 RepID=UPI0037DA5632